MDGDMMIKAECVARVMALTVAASATIEGMKAENTERISADKALAYDAKAFFEVGEELTQSVRGLIGF